eukprot:scaffold277676_cov21-Tisochrysis_lutea.AAC.2
MCSRYLCSVSDPRNALQEYLDREGELRVEVARYVEPDKALLGDSEAAWHAYHGLAVLSDADVLLEGGTNKIGGLPEFSDILGDSLVAHKLGYRLECAASSILTC